MALDYGSARTGVAVSDPTGTLARPLTIVERVGTEAGLAELVRLVREEDAERIVVGLPLTLRGERGEQAVETERFVESLRAAVDVPVELFDERFTTGLAQQTAGAAPEDAVAAAHLLAGCGGSSAAPTTTIRQLRQFGILFPEGFTRAQMVARVKAVAQIAENKSHRKVKLSATAYRAVTRRPRVIAGFGTKKLHMEGFLFPNTYNFDRKSTSAYLVQEQLRVFQANWRKVDMSYAQSKNLTPYDVLKIASMIQGEVAAPSENKLVAAVIYNRLRLGMSLGLDATLRYGLRLKPTQSLGPFLDSNSPYNTRKFPGLTPTPIGNPGLAAIEAAAHPARVDYLYFVRKPDHRHHYFTASYQDFLNHEAQYGY